MSDLHRQPVCFFCDTLLKYTEARILVPSGKIYGDCCVDLALDLDQVIPE